MGQEAPSSTREGARVLILTRRVGEAINIGEDIVLKIIEITGRQVRLGIDAPPETLIHREEVFRKIQEENLRAAAAGVRDLDDVGLLLNDDPGSE